MVSSISSYFEIDSSNSVKTASEGVQVLPPLLPLPLPLLQNLREVRSPTLAIQYTRKNNMQRKETRDNCSNPIGNGRMRRNEQAHLVSFFFQCRLHTRCCLLNQFIKFSKERAIRIGIFSKKDFCNRKGTL